MASTLTTPKLISTEQLQRSINTARSIADGTHPLCTGEISADEFERQYSYRDEMRDDAERHERRYGDAR